MFPALYVIVDPILVAESPVSFSRKMAAAGARLIQLRDKQGSPRAVCRQAREMARDLAPLGVRLIVNDRPDIAAIVGAGGTHVGQDDLAVEDARKVCGNACWVGVSTHDLDQVRAAERTSADYIAVGPVFTTSTKANPDPVVGPAFLRAARQLTRKPLVAIGGITVESAGRVFQAGADSVAVVRDILLADDPAGRVTEYLTIAERERSA